MSWNDFEMETDRFLVDTSAWLWVLKRTFIPALKDRLDRLLREDAVLIPGIIRLELLGGVGTQKEFQRLRNRLGALDTLTTDQAVWDEACDLAFLLRRKGVNVPYTDILIAAHATNSAAILLHADAHFDVISRHTDLQVESWVQAATHAITDPPG
jgi:predicted nucleic acid-binding protein